MEHSAEETQTPSELLPDVVKSEEDVKNSDSDDGSYVMMNKEDAPTPDEAEERLAAAIKEAEVEGHAEQCDLLKEEKEVDSSEEDGWTYVLGHDKLKKKMSEGRRSRKENWRNEEEMLLMRAYKERAPVFLSKFGHQAKMRAWQEVADAVNRIGANRSSLECRSKVKNIKCISRKKRSLALKKFENEDEIEFTPSETIYMEMEKGKERRAGEKDRGGSVEGVPDSRTIGDALLCPVDESIASSLPSERDLIELQREVLALERQKLAHEKEVLNQASKKRDVEKRDSESLQREVLLLKVEIMTAEKRFLQEEMEQSRVRCNLETEKLKLEILNLKKK